MSFFGAISKIKFLSRDLCERIIEAIERIPEYMFQCNWQEIVHRLDIITVTTGA